jgi:hypothetical protein
MNVAIAKGYPYFVTYMNLRGRSGDLAINAHATGVASFIGDRSAFD